jgi:NADPH-dependent curcumin reductase
MDGSSLVQFQAKTSLHSIRPRFSAYRAMAAPLVRSGQLKYREDVVEGLDNAPEAFIGLLQGRNFGKLLVKLGDDPDKSVC